MQIALKRVDPVEFAAALGREITHRQSEFLTGVEAYRAADREQPPPLPPAIWKDGTTSLFDYGLPGKPGHPVLVVPSLVNRSRILDLTVESSFLRYLAQRGLRPLLVDWGIPNELDLRRSLDDYISGKLLSALKTANSVAGNRGVPVIGYCMGGALATALAALAGERVSSLVALATPWDFHAPHSEPPVVVTACCSMLDSLVASKGFLPADVLQTIFFCIDPTQSWSKFRRFATIAQNSREFELFIAVEDWVNDGVPLAGPVARTCLADWYMKNLPAIREWRVEGELVDPAKIRVPALVVVPAHDHIVTPQSATLLADQIPGARRLMPRTGHIGMIVGRRMADRLWRPLLNWLLNPS